MVYKEASEELLCVRNKKKKKMNPFENENMLLSLLSARQQHKHQQRVKECRGWADG
jgi:hypothetical protein